MHADFRIGDSTLLASDGSCSGATAFQGFSLSLTTAQEAETEQLFAALSAGGHVGIPLMSTRFTAWVTLLYAVEPWGGALQALV